MKLSSKNKDYIFYPIFIAIWIFLFWRCRYGCTSYDEAFYISLPLRFVKGDAMFANEWHRALLSGFIEMPLTFIDNLLFGVEGMILRYRYYYVFFHGLTCLFVYNRLKTFDKLGSLLGSIVLLMYAPFSIIALSYNSFGIMFLSIALTLLVTNKDNKIEYLLMGVCFSLAVVSCPFLVLLYVIYFVYYLLRRKEDRNLDKQFLYSFIGIVVMAILFVSFVLTRSSIDKIIECLPYMMDDPERIDKNIFLFPIDYVKAILDFMGFKKYVYIAYFIGTIICIFDSKRIMHRHYYLFINIVIVIVDLCFSVYTHFYINHIIYPITMLGPVFLLFKDEDITKLLFYYWLPAMIYTVCLYLSSNTGFHAISSSAIVASVSSIVMLVRAFRIENHDTLRKVIFISTVILLTVQIVSLGYLRYSLNFGTDTIEYQSEYVDYGFEKGINVSVHNKETYDEYYEDVRSMNIEKGSKVLFLSEKTWLYLIDKDYENASYSAWLSEKADKIIPYYQINEDKIPDYVLADEYYFDICHKLNEILHYKESKTSSGKIVLTNSN